MARRRFFVEEVRDGNARLVGDDAHHLTRVLRVETGQKFEISDNLSVYLAQVETARKDLVTFAVLGEVPSVPPPVRVALYACLIRFERFELMLEKATELGVERVIPVSAERSEKGLDRAAGKRMARWNRIVREASEQSRRTRMTDLCAPMRFERAVASGTGLRLTLEENAGTQPLLAALPDRRSDSDEVSLLIGPEGGWTDRERTSMSEKGWRSVSLGNTILRAETAAIAAVAIVNAAWHRTD